MSGPVHQPASGEGRRLLIVEDDEAVLKGTGDYFAKLKYEVIRAATGRQGISGYDTYEPDVTLLDLKLPDISGLEVLETLRRKHAVVIMLTGYGDIETAVRAMQLGAENFLTKPVDMPHLVAAVERAMEKLELRRENQRLLKLVPSTKRKVQRAVATVLMVLAALWIGNLVADLGSRQRQVVPIAPRRAPPDTAKSRDIDSILYPSRSGRAAPDTTKR